MRLEQKYQACVAALESYASEAGFSEALLGLSGGIDSSLAAAMCVSAFGADCVHGILLPGPYSSQGSVDDALDLADRLGIATRTISICEPFEAFEKALGRACGGALEGLAAENTQARCRMICLMALSNTYGWMLVNTGNKSESAMGYSTLYGDTAGVFAPLGGLYKTDVFALCDWLNAEAEKRGERPPIPQNIIDKPPSAELAPNQEDEASLGIDYASLDAILIGVYEHGEDAEDVARRLGLSEQRVAEILSRVDRYAFKRAQEPPYPQTEFYR